MEGGTAIGDSGKQATSEEPASDSRLLDRMQSGILSVIGNTPLVRLTRLLPDAPFELYAKLEALNPGARLGLRFICVVDVKTTAQNISILRAFGAEVDVVDRPDPVTGEYLPVRIERVRQLVASHPRSFWPNQYANPDNTLAHGQAEGRVRAPAR